MFRELRGRQLALLVAVVILTPIVFADLIADAAAAGWKALNRPSPNEWRRRSQPLSVRFQYERQMHWTSFYDSTGLWVGSIPEGGYARLRLPDGLIGVWVNYDGRPVFWDTEANPFPGDTFIAAKP